MTVIRNAGRRLPWIGLAALLSQVFGLLWLAEAAQAQPAEARIASVRGKAVRYNGQRAFVPARGDVLAPGDEIDTAGGGRVTIQLTDGSVVVVQPRSRIVINDYRAAPSLRELFRIVVGQVRVRIQHYGGRPNPYRVNSPTASVLVRGTEFGVAVEPAGDTRVIVYEGLVEVASLSDPQRRALVSRGRGVLVRPNEDLRFFTPGARAGIGEREGNGVNRFAGQGVNAGAGIGGNLRPILANDYERYTDSIVEPGQSPQLVRFTAFADSHLDSLENPAYATEFRSLEGRAWGMPSLQGRSLGFAGIDSGTPRDGGWVGHGTLFVPLSPARAVIGGGFGMIGSRTHSATETAIRGLPNPLYPEGVPGLRRATSATETSSLVGALVVARRFGEAGRTSLGFGVDSIRGTGSLRGQTSLTNSAGVDASERLEAASQILRRRFNLGLTHEFAGGHKLSALHRHGLAAAADRDLSRLFNGLPLSLDAVSYRGRSFETMLRLRGPITRRLFYGLEFSRLQVRLREQIRRAVIVDSTERESIVRTDLNAGLGYALRRNTLLGVDLSLGLARVDERHFEDATGNPLEDRRKRTRFASFHFGFQTSLWRSLFVTASGLAVHQTRTLDLALHPDRFGRRMTSYGLIEPEGRTRRFSLLPRYDLGAGWRFAPELTAEYLFSLHPGAGAPRHAFVLRYVFRPER